MRQLSGCAKEPDAGIFEIIHSGFHRVHDGRARVFFQHASAVKWKGAFFSKCNIPTSGSEISPLGSTGCASLRV